MATEALAAGGDGGSGGALRPQGPPPAASSHQGGSGGRTYESEAQPWRFLALARAFGPSRAFQVAVRMGLFGALRAHKEANGGAGMTAAEVAAALGLQAGPGFRGVADVLDLLVAENCLEREGDGPAAVYKNTPDGERFLCPGGRDYIGGLVVVNCERTYPQFVFLEDSLRTGAQPPAAKALVPDILETFGGEADPGATARFALGMTGANQAAFGALASRFGWARYKTLLDVGGSAGSLSVAVAAAHPHISAVTADLLAVLPAALENIKREGLEGGVAAREVDFFADESFPGADVITMSMILHDWGLEKKLLLMRKAFAALPPGGAFIALDLVIDDARRRNRWGLYMSLSMLTEFDRENAFDYTYAEFRGWAAEVGFDRTEIIDLGGPASAVVAYKPGTLP